MQRPPSPLTFSYGGGGGGASNENGGATVIGTSNNSDGKNQIVDGSYHYPSQHPPPPQHSNYPHYSTPQPYQMSGYGANPYARPPPPPSAPPRPASGSAMEMGEADFLRSATESITGNGVPTKLGLQLGSHMIYAGQDYVNKNIAQKIPMGTLKTYFNVTNSYVLHKLLIILFPFRHKSWQRLTIPTHPYTPTPMASSTPIYYAPPREDINSPDLYIPFMAAVTYVLLVGLVLGLRRAFQPEKLGVTATGAIIFIILEVLLVKLGAYLLSLDNGVAIIDMLAIIGYNFVPLIVTLLGELFLGRTARLVFFAYCSLAMAFFMLRSLRYSFLPDSGAPLVVNQRRTRVHFLFGIVFIQIICSYLLLV